MKSTLASTLPALAFALLVFTSAGAQQTDQEIHLWKQAQALQDDYEQRCTLVKDQRLAQGLNETLSRLAL